LEIGQFDDKINNLLEKNSFLEKKNEEFKEKINVTHGEAEFLRNENKNLKLNNEILMNQNENLRRNNQEFLKKSIFFKF